MSKARVVEVKRTAGKGFGFSIIGGSDTHLPPMICNVTKDGALHKTRKVGHFDSRLSTFTLFSTSHDQHYVLLTCSRK